MASGLGVLTTTSTGSTLNTNCIFCHIFIFPCFKASGWMLPYCLLSEVNSKVSCCVSEMCFLEHFFLFFRLSGFMLPSPIVSSGSILALWFTTDFAVSAQGFKAVYEGKTVSACMVM